MKRRILSIVLTLCMVLAFMPQTAFAETYGVFEYSVSDNKVTITKYNGSGDAVEIPSTINGNPVTTIGESAFRGSGITSITIPDSVSSIGEYAFYSCSSLTNVTIPNGVTSIRNRAFYNCRSLKSVTIPNSVTTIGAYAFDACVSLTSITIPNSVAFIGESAFSNCKSLTNVTIPNSVTTVGVHAFSNCKSLTNVTIPNSVTTIGEGAFYGCEGLTSITIPISVTTIGESAFSNCKSLTNVTIPNSVTTIGAYAFDVCTRLTSITIPNSVAFIGAYAFRRTPWLMAKQNENPLVVINGILIDGSTTTTGTVSITNDITSIGDCAFYGSGITSITIPDSVTYIGKHAFYNCSSLTSITIPNSVTSIGYATFQGCTGLTNVTIPDSVSSIGEYAFYSCSSLTNVTIPNGVTSIRNRAFYNCISLTSITIPNSVTSIGEFAFRYCKLLTSITIPNSVTSIGESAFRDCTGLTNVTIPSSVTSIGGYAFQNCTGLESIFLPDGLGVSSANIRGEATQVKYSLDAEGKVTITGITLGTNKTSVDIPAEICGYPVVAVADNYQTLVGTHTCKGGTATCTAKALCDICGKEYGALKEHTYNWQSQDGKYWEMCQNCGAETTKKDIPTITIIGADSVCETQDYEFSFTLPQGVTDATYGCDFGNRGFGGIDPTIKNGKMCGEIAANLYGTSEGSFKIIIDAKTADGFDFSVSKTVSLNKEHSDSEPKDHLCDICGEIVSVHNLEKIPAKDATVTEIGNKEYWHCKDCGKYFSDENGKSEINDLAAWKAEEGKLAKLPPEIINGKGMSITAGKTKELTFRSNADFSDFIRVELDGKTLDAKYYTAKEGSTIITLKADYVASLPAGDHTIGIVSTSGTATTEFTVNAQAASGNDSPKTGDNSNLLLWIALLFVSGGMMTAAGGYRKRENHS